MRKLPLATLGAATALGLLATAAQAEPVKLTLAQMDELTAGQAEAEATAGESTASASADPGGTAKAIASTFAFAFASVPPPEPPPDNGDDG